MKDITECHARLRGLFNITVTPFKADGAFDYAGLARNIERVIGLGYDGILIGGTYGEFPAMSAEERADLFRRLGETEQARGSYEKALGLTRLEPARRFLQRRLTELSKAG